MALSGEDRPWHLQSLLSSNRSAKVPMKKECVIQQCKTVCDELFRARPGTVFYQNDEGYSTQQSTYFARQQASLNPSCFFQPQNETDVSHAVRLASKEGCPFAVKSGGHATFGGASNIRGGLTISLELLNEITLIGNGSLVRIGPGNRWYDVYRELEKNNMTVPGGRTGSAVLSNGSIVNVNASSYPDLHWALRGGGSNFAIITRFDFKPIHHEMMWGGIRNYTIDQVEALLDAYVDIGFRGGDNPSAYQITTLYYTEAKHHATVDLYNTEPEPDAPIFNSLNQAHHYSDTTALNRQSNISWINYQGQPDGHRQTYWTVTYKLNRELAGFVKDVFLEESGQLGNLTGLEARCILQVFTTDILRQMQKNGGNPMGIGGGAQPLMILNFAFRWEDSADDMRILRSITNLINRVNVRTHATGLYEPFLYMNYASGFQDVLESYGTENLNRLKDISRKYDPDQVFQTLQRGYFKLSGRVGW
ncbi:hypothetical protein BDV59DRAFT_208689 [Aspergillus ambiguus]|uniref:uncharacterized protein n=1 Tax=Aspergillus ambiguus TaxID=176160 RepID=UPI003CCD2E41